MKARPLPDAIRETHTDHETGRERVTYYCPHHPGREIRFTLVNHRGKAYRLLYCPIGGGTWNENLTPRRLSYDG